jgi:hypothetical protein
MLPPSAARSANLPRASRFALLYPLALGAVAGLLYAPFFCRECIVTTDHDVLSMLGWLRVTPNWIGWASGYYVNSVLTSALNELLNLLGIAHDDYALAYQILMLCALLGLVLGTYGIVHWAVKSRTAATLAALAVILLPGMMRLAVLLEDNLVDQALQLQFLAVYLWYLNDVARAGRFGWHEIFLALSLWLAVNAHHQMNVLWVTPLALFYLLRGTFPAREIAKRALGIYGISIFLFLGAYVLLTIGWAGQFSPSLYARWVRLWFIPNEFYQGYYFFNRYGWDPARQVAHIAAGISQLVRVDGDADALVYAGYVTLLVLLALPFWRFVRRTRTVAVCALWVGLNIPHSLIYEPENLERWDAPVVPAIILISIVLASAWRERRNERGLVRASAPLAALLIAALFVCSGAFYVQSVERVRQAVVDPEWQTLQPVLLAQVAPGPRVPGARRVLLLTEEEFSRFFMVAELYFNHERDIYGITRAGALYRSPALFPEIESVSREQFHADTRGAHIVYSPAGRASAEAVLP